MFHHPKMNEFDAAMRALFHEVDEEMEAAWGDCYPLHPTRPARGETKNPAADGLFDVASDFTPGFGSEHGRGYRISCRLKTLDAVSAPVREMMLDEAAERARGKLKRFFPGRALQVVRDGEGYKITGDFSLGST